MLKKKPDKRNCKYITNKSEKQKDTTKKKKNLKIDQHVTSWKISGLSKRKVRRIKKIINQKT